MPWSIDDLATDFASWLLSEDGAADTSRTGILCFPELTSLLTAHFDRGFCRLASLVLYVTSVVYDRGLEYSELPGEFAQVRAVASTLVLRILEEALKPSSLERTKSSKAGLQALFLLVLTMLMAVSYCRVGNEHDTPSAPQSHLTRMLSHHLVTVMDALGLLSSDPDRIALRDMKYSRLHRPNNFQWGLDAIDDDGSHLADCAYLSSPAAQYWVTSGKCICVTEPDILRQTTDVNERPGLPQQADEQEGSLSELAWLLGEFHTGPAWFDQPEQSLNLTDCEDAI